jgi:outer membrane immunogenic protein
MSEAETPLTKERLYVSIALEDFNDAGPDSPPPKREHEMKKRLLSVVSLALMTGAASGADLPSHKVETLLPPPPPPKWSGFYLGLNAGGTWGNNNPTNVFTWPTKDLSGYWTTAALLTGNRSTEGSAGFIGGGQVGYNWLMNAQGYGFLAGFEADIQGIAGGSRFDQSPLSGVTLSFSGHDQFATYTTSSSSNYLSYIGTARGRVGFLATPSLLVYGTGGLAYGEANLSFGQAQQFGIAVGASNSTAARTLAGWTAGGGVEWMFMPNWSIKAEYLYYNLGKLSTHNHFVALSPSGAQWTYDAHANRSFNGNIVRAGVNYHLNWDASSILAKF